MSANFLRSFQYDKSNKSIHHYLRSSSKCESCFEFGHISSQCYQTLKKCIFCTSSSHSFQKCPENLCHLCKNPFHTVRNCTSTKRCIQCNISGHLETECLSTFVPIRSESFYKSTCLNCRQTGHLNCSVVSVQENLYSRTCASCGLTGHPFAECPKKCKISKAQLFKSHVKEAMKSLPDFDRKLNCKERKYWEKVKTKAFKKIVKINKLRKKKKGKAKKV